MYCTICVQNEWLNDESILYNSTNFQPHKIQSDIILSSHYCESREKDEIGSHDYFTAKEGPTLGQQ